MSVRLILLATSVLAVVLIVHAATDSAVAAVAATVALAAVLFLRYEYRPKWRLLRLSHGASCGPPGARNASVVSSRLTVRD